MKHVWAGFGLLGSAVILAVAGLIWMYHDACGCIVFDPAGVKSLRHQHVVAMYISRKDAAGEIEHFAVDSRSDINAVTRSFVSASYSWHSDTGFSPDADYVVAFCRETRPPKFVEVLPQSLLVPIRHGLLETQISERERASMGVAIDEALSIAENVDRHAWATCGSP